MPTAAIIRKRKRLPHWETAGSTYFVTFRLADSLPAAALQRLRDERRAALEEVRSGPAANRPAAEKRFRRLFSRRVEEFLDKGSGACLLANPRLAQIVAGALCHFDGIRYELYAWCVMPNHVHVVFRPFSAYSLAGILHTWKSFTAHRAPAALARGGPLWQREYFDHLSRDAGQLARAVQYVAENPIRAGLKGWKWVEVYKRD